MGTVTTLIDEGKKSLDTLLREKAYDDIAEKLEENGIDIDKVTDEYNDVEDRQILCAGKYLQEIEV